jgi:hypothetical protein
MRLGVEMQSGDVVEVVARRVDVIEDGSRAASTVR